jgi:hypothetical protein
MLLGEGCEMAQRWEIITIKSLSRTRYWSVGVDRACEVPDRVGTDSDNVFLNRR